MSETLNTEAPDQSSPAELAEQMGFETYIRPIDELPRVATDVAPGQEFWSRRALRPDEPGPNFHNIPALKFGVTYENDQAVLTVPSLDYVNQFVDNHNPGGFRFIGTSHGLVSGEQFVSATINGEFVVSSNTDAQVTINDWVGEHGQIADEPHKFQSNYHEHDRVDHLGLAAIEAVEARKISSLAQALSQIADGKSLRGPNITNFDALLSSLSDYALLPVEPVFELDTALKESTKKVIRDTVRQLVHPVIATTFVENKTADSYAEDKRFDAEKEALVDKYCPDFEVIDETLARLQGLQAA